MTNQLEAEIRAINHSINHCKKELQKTTDPNIQEKIEHYIAGLEIELDNRLREANRP